MKLIQHINGVVVDILNVRDDTTIETIALADSIPIFVPREGYNGVLKYSSEKGLYWDYDEVPESDTVTVEEKAAAYDIIMGESQ